MFDLKGSITTLTFPSPLALGDYSETPQVHNQSNRLKKTSVVVTKLQERFDTTIANATQPQGISSRLGKG